MKGKAKKDVDTRFDEIKWHPKYSRLRQSSVKTKIDKRFQDMFTDPKFTVKYKVDLRGRPMSKSSTDNLKRYYQLSDDEAETSSRPANAKKTATKLSDEEAPAEDDDEDEDEDGGDDDEKFVQENAVVDKKRALKTTHVGDDEDGNNDDDDDNDNDNDNEEEEEESRKEEGESVEDEDDYDIRLDLARGDGNVTSSSDSESEWEVEDDEDLEVHEWNEHGTGTTSIDEPTSRLALCNLDWDRITAKDLLIMLNSQKPAAGVVKSVKIYPSEYGLQRMAEEAKSGPIELADLSCDEDNDDFEDNLRMLEPEQRRKKHRKELLLNERVRKYQFCRLKYFYAVVECDSVTTADTIYTNCDGVEFEVSGSRIDCRFIPNDTTFDHAPPKDVATSVGDLENYKPLLVSSNALKQSKAILTWEEEHHPRRVELTQKAFKDPECWDNTEFNDLLAPASASESEEDDGELLTTQKNKDALKELIAEAKAGKSDHKKNGEMEIQWVPEKDEQLMTDQIKKNPDKLTPFEQYLARRKEKKRERKEAIRQKRLAVKRKREGLDEESDIPESVDVKDPYFREALEEMSNSKKRKATKKSKGKSSEEDDNTNADELALLLADEDQDDGKRHFNLKKLIKAEELKESKSKKAKRSEVEKVDTFEMNVTDPRFDAIYSSHVFNIDPTDPNYKKTAGTKLLIEEKVKRKTALLASGRSKVHDVEPQPDTDPIAAKPPTKQEISSLVDRLKSKTRIFQHEKRKKEDKKKPE